MRHTIHNMRHTTHNMRHTTHNMRHTTYNMRHTIMLCCSPQEPLACPTQYVSYYTARLSTPISTTQPASAPPSSRCACLSNPHHACVSRCARPHDSATCVHARFARMQHSLACVLRAPSQHPPPSQPLSCGPPPHSSKRSASLSPPLARVLLVLIHARAPLPPPPSFPTAPATQGPLRLNLPLPVHFK